MAHACDPHAPHSGETEAGGLLVVNKSGLLHKPNKTHTPANKNHEQKHISFLPLLRISKRHQSAQIFAVLKVKNFKRSRKKILFFKCFKPVKQWELPVKN